MSPSLDDFFGTPKREQPSGKDTTPPAEKLEDPFASFFGGAKPSSSTPEPPPSPATPSTPASAASMFPPKPPASAPATSASAVFPPQRPATTTPPTAPASSMFPPKSSVRGAPSAADMLRPKSPAHPVSSAGAMLPPKAPSSPTSTSPSRAAAPSPVAPKTPLPLREVPLGLPVPIPGFTGSGKRLFTEDEPVLALSRAQSGMGALTFELDAAEGLMLSCVYETVAGDQRVIVDAEGSDQYVHMVAGRRKLSINLRNSTTLDRFMVVVSSISPATVWQGTVSTVTAAGGRITAHLDRPNEHETCAQFTGYKVNGKVVLRAESDHKAVPLKRLCEDYGYDQVAWRDERTPL